MAAIGLFALAALALAALAVDARAQEPERAQLIFTVDAYRGDLVVDSVDLAYPGRVQALRVVLGGSRLVIRGDRSVAFAYHEPTRWGVITPRQDGATVTVELPAHIRAFEVRVGGEPIWSLRAGRARASCEPVGEIVRPDGTVEWVFTPEEGRFRCERPPRPVRPA